MSDSEVRRADYLHGYSGRESQRLLDQAATLAELLHWDTVFPPGSDVLEAGCGVGAQTVAIAGASPGARIRSVDLSAQSLQAAKARVARAGIGNVTFLQADIFNLPSPCKASTTSSCASCSSTCAIPSARSPHLGVS